MPTDLRTNQGRAEARRSRPPTRRAVKRAVVRAPAVAHYARPFQRVARKAPAVGRRVHLEQAHQEYQGLRHSQRAFHSQDRNPAQVIHRRRTQARQQEAYLRGPARRYRAYTRRLWQQAARYYPSGAKRPKTRPRPLGLNLRGDLNAGPPLAWVMPGQHAINVTPFTVYALHGSNRELRRYAHSVPIHEWAHVFQRDPMGMPWWLREGGAESFEQLVAPRVGLRSQTNRTYAPLARRVRRTRGSDYVLRGQFDGY